MIARIIFQSVPVSGGTALEHIVAMTKFSRFHAAALSLLAGSAAPALAQASPDDSTGLADIVVTAQRRSENLQDVPISVDVLSGQKLDAITSGGLDIRALAGRTPSLNIESSFGRTFPRFYIRGLGNTDFDFNASQPVSLVYDDVVLENPILKGFPIFDLDRVEVLRGPQGTLFGRNTPAGIVKFDSTRPSSTLGGYGRVSYGTYNAVSAQGAVGGPLAGDVLSARISALYQRQDDWVDNTNPSAPKANALEGYTDFAARAQLLFKPDPNLDILVSGQIRRLRGTARVFRANIFQRGKEGIIPGFRRDQVAIDGQNEQRVNTWNLGANITYDFGPVSLISVTSYWDGDATSVGDVDGGFGASFLPPALTGPGYIPFTAETRDSVPKLTQFTQELRLASNGSGPLSYQAGFFYFDEKLDIRSDNYSTLGDPNNAVEGINIIVSQQQKSEAYAFFGSASYKLTDALTVSGGVRYNNDKRRYQVDRTRDRQFPNFLQSPLGTVKRSVSGDNVTWDASANYAASDDVNIYARVARGYRAPSIQGRILFPPATATPLEDGVTVAKSETLMSYEGGIKSQFWNGRGRLNLGGFLYNLKNAQLTAVGGGVNANRLINAKNVRGYGFELDGELRPATGLTLTAGVSYNHTEIRDPGLTTAACGAVRTDTFPNVSLCTILDPIVTPAAPFAPAIVNINGNSLPQAPRWIVNWTAGYELPVGAGKAYVFTDWAYRSKINFFLYESVEFQDKRLLEGGLRVGYRTGQYDIAGFVRNITDDVSAVGGIDFNNLTGFVNEPRTFGVEVGVKF